MTRRPHERIFVALDTPEIERARDLVRRLRGHVGGFKVGLELFTSHGSGLVREIRDGGDEEVFLDLKLHDIPNTVAGAAAAAALCGVSLLTVHALGGPEMIRRGADAARDAAAREGVAPPRILAVTVLTSHDDAQLDAIGLRGPCAEAVVRLTELARDAGADGLVCSPLELARVRPLFRDGLIVVPGIRPAGAGPVSRDDQARTATPAATIRAGADRLVVGRPITRADDPGAAADAIAAEIGRDGER